MAAAKSVEHAYAEGEAPERERLERIDRLKPAQINPRTHSEQQVRQVADSILEFGWTNPILYDYRAEETVAGHGRQLAAALIYSEGGVIHMAPGPKARGRQLPPGTVPVVSCTGWSDAQRKAYLLADNQLALNAGWDEPALFQSLGELHLGGFDVGVIGFPDTTLARVFNGPPAVDPEATPPPPKVPVTKLGDVWQLGDHRLMCGDSTVVDDVAQLLAGAKPHLMVTDQPYGVEYDPEWRAHRTNADGSRFSSGNDRALGEVENDGKADWREAWALFPGTVAYVWCASLLADQAIAGLEAAGLMRRCQIIWRKNHFAVGRGDYHWLHEPCWYAVRKGGKSHFVGGRKQTSVWDIDKLRKADTGHSTQKPVECMRRPIENNSLPGEAVYDPFVGSGTTIIAAEMTKRRCFAMELRPAHVDVALLRWQEFTGETAQLASGMTYAEAKAQRNA